MSFLSLILPAMVPALSDGMRGLFARFTNGSGAQPQNVAERIQLMQAQTERVRALAEIDALSPNAAEWVANLRGAFRYVAVGAILSATLLGSFVQIEAAALAMLLDLSGASMAFIIGERMYLGIKK